MKSTTNNNSQICKLGVLLEAINEELFSNEENELERRVEEIALINGYHQQRQLISEGLLRSFPAEVLCRRIAKAYSGKVQNVEFTTTNKFDNNLPCVGIAVDAKSNPQIFKTGIKRELDVSGWFESTPARIDDFDFEPTPSSNPLAQFGFCHRPGVQKALIIWVKARYPIFTENVSAFTEKVLKSTKTFYHVSLERLMARIQPSNGTGGLIPQASNTGDYWYPERNYVFGSKSAMINWINQILGPDFEKTVSKNLRRIGNDVRMKEEEHKERKEAKVADEQYQNLTNWPITIYTADLKRMVSDGRRLRLYRDNNWESKIPAYFTPDPIPQQYLNDVTKAVMAPFVSSKPSVLRGQKQVFDENRP